MSYHKSNNKGLWKFLAYNIKLILILGLVTLIYIIYKYNPPISNIFSSSKEEKPKCENLSTKIILESNIQDIKESDNKLILLTSPHHGMQQVVIFDYCKNKVINHLYIEVNNKSNKVIKEIDSGFLN